MRKVRAALLPMLLLIGLTALAWLDVRLDRVAHFGFIWDVLLGLMLGMGLCALPALSGFSARRNALTGMYWVCGFASLLLIFYQYTNLLTGVSAEPLAFLTDPGPRMRIVEGALLGFTSLMAGRGKA